jgi:PAS domain S-box-containing protein
MERSSSGLRAYAYAFVTLCVTLGIFLYLWLVVEPAFFVSEEFIAGLCFVVVALLTVIVFQAARMSSTASALAQGMAESMLMYSKELFTELYRGSPVPYLLIDQDGRVDSANLAAIRLFGVQEGWFQGKLIFDYLQAEKEDDIHIDLIPQYLKQHVPVNDVEVMIAKSDGTVRWVLFSLFSFTDANRKYKGLLTLVDVTKQKEIDKAKTEFVSLASHQLRTPISAMRWNLELLTTSGLKSITDTERDYLAKIERGVERMDVLVADFLSVSKLELGTFVPKMETLPFDLFMQAILESHEAKASARGITIGRYWDQGDTIVADSHLLEMAVNNLVSNAVKYSRDNSTITITLEKHPGNYVIAVSDTGIGIPAEEHDKIFTKIYRASNAKAEVPDGTGLGLYIVREAVRVMGGDVTFVSELGKGTTFTLVLPVQ